MRIPRLAILAYVIAITVIVGDQALKHWILADFHLQDRGSVAVFGPLSLTMVWNHGVSFGVFNSDAEWTRWALCGFSGAVAIALAVWAARTDQAILAIALGFIIGGAVGNLIDRVRLGAVVDFINFGHWCPWVFNVADAAINVGSVLLIWDLFLAPRKRTAG